MTPSVTVLMPVFNAATTVVRAIDSVLSQSFDDFELVIVDDGSSDGSAQILNRYAERPSVTVLRNPANQGLVASLNRGLGIARGRYIARLDADDVASIDRLALQVAALERQPGSVLSATGYRRVRPDGTLVGVRVPPLTHATLAVSMLGGNRIAHSTAMFRTDTALRVGGYRADWFPVEDYDLWLRLLDNGVYVGVAATCADYLENPAGISSERSEEQHRRHRARSQAYKVAIDPAWNDLGGRWHRVRAEAAVLDALVGQLRSRLLPLTGVAVAGRQVLHEQVKDLRRVPRVALLSLAAPRWQFARLFPRAVGG